MKTFSGRPPSQDESELRDFIELLRAQEVHSYCEIGARHGDTFHEIMNSLPVGSFGLAVDMPGGVWGKRGTDKTLRTVVHDLRHRGYYVEMVLGDSHAAATQRRVRSFGPFDALFIDADHTLEGVTTDWHAYRHMSRIVAMHDINGKGQTDKTSGLPVEVHKLWEQLRDDEAQCIELVNPSTKFGIGVVMQ